MPVSQNSTRFSTAKESPCLGRIRRAVGVRLARLPLSGARRQDAVEWRQDERDGKIAHQLAAQATPLRADSPRARRVKDSRRKWAALRVVRNGISGPAQ